jgi:hypothetical protein
MRNKLKTNIKAELDLCFGKFAPHGPIYIVTVIPYLKPENIWNFLLFIREGCEDSSDEAFNVCWDIVGFDDHFSLHHVQEKDFEPNMIIPKVVYDKAERGYVWEKTLQGS